jgi:hypothetical protein
LASGVQAKSPWPGHNDLAVNKKTFAYLSAEGDQFSISVKLPYAGYEALKPPFAALSAWTISFVDLMLVR